MKQAASKAFQFLEGCGSARVLAAGQFFVGCHSRAFTLKVTANVSRRSSTSYREAKGCACVKLPVCRVCKPPLLLPVNIKQHTTEPSSVKLLISARDAHFKPCHSCSKALGFYDSDRNMHGNEHRKYKSSQSRVISILQNMGN